MKTKGGYCPRLYERPFLRRSRLAPRYVKGTSYPDIDDRVDVETRQARGRAQEEANQAERDGRARGNSAADASRASRCMHAASERGSNSCRFLLIPGRHQTAHALKGAYRVGRLTWHRARCSTEANLDMVALGTTSKALGSAPRSICYGGHQPWTSWLFSSAMICIAFCCSFCVDEIAILLPCLESATATVKARPRLEDVDLHCRRSS